MKFKISCANAVILAATVRGESVDLYVCAKESVRNKTTGLFEDQETKLNMTSNVKNLVENAYRLKGAKVAIEGVVSQKVKGDKTYTNYYINEAEITTYPKNWKELGQRQGVGQPQQQAPQHGHGQPQYNGQHQQAPVEGYPAHYADRH